MDNIGSLLGDAAVLMGTGMTFVFLFLTILVYLVTLMAKIIPQEQPAAPVVPSKRVQNNQSSTTGNNPHVVAAISAAVKQYRSSSAKK
ncbi:oxaloacetate decarboxylase subunit gamma [Vibrio sp. WJH972]